MIDIVALQALTAKSTFIYTPIWEVLWSVVSRFLYSNEPVHFILGDIK